MSKTVKVLLTRESIMGKSLTDAKKLFENAYGFKSKALTMVALGKHIEEENAKLSQAPTETSKGTEQQEEKAGIDLTAVEYTQEALTKLTNDVLRDIAYELKLSSKTKLKPMRKALIVDLILKGTGVATDVAEPKEEQQAMALPKETQAPKKEQAPAETQKDTEKVVDLKAKNLFCLIKNAVYRVLGYQGEQVVVHDVNQNKFKFPKKWIDCGKVKMVPMSTAKDFKQLTDTKAKVVNALEQNAVTEEALIYRHSGAVYVVAGEKVYKANNMIPKAEKFNALVKNAKSFKASIRNNAGTKKGTGTKNKSGMSIDTANRRATLLELALKQSPNGIEGKSADAINREILALKKFIEANEKAVNKISEKDKAIVPKNISQLPSGLF